MAVMKLAKKSGDSWEFFDSLYDAFKEHEENKTSIFEVYAQDDKDIKVSCEVVFTLDTYPKDHKFETLDEGIEDTYSPLSSDHITNSHILLTDRDSNEIGIVECHSGRFNIKLMKQAISEHYCLEGADISITLGLADEEKVIQNKQSTHILANISNDPEKLFTPYSEPITISPASIYSDMDSKPNK